MIYGPLHATAWDATFPTKSQQIVGRISSMTLMAPRPVHWLIKAALMILHYVYSQDYCPQKGVIKTQNQV
jgi:hypothetical protein